MVAVVSCSQTLNRHYNSSQIFSIRLIKIRCVRRVIEFFHSVISSYYSVIACTSHNLANNVEREAFHLRTISKQYIPQDFFRFGWYTLVFRVQDTNTIRLNPYYAKPVHTIIHLLPNCRAETLHFCKYCSGSQEVYKYPSDFHNI